MSIMPINESINEIHEYMRTCHALACAEVQKDYESVLSFSGFQKVWYNLSWKDVV